MKKNKLILGSFILLIFSIHLLSQQEVVIPIRDGMPAVPIALPKFFIPVHSNPQIQAAAETLHKIITANIKFSRVFQSLPSTYYSYIRKPNPKNIIFKDWESIQAKILLIGEIQKDGNEDILFEGKVYDVKSERFIFGKRYKADPTLLRLVAHKMCDELMKNFGEKPIFTSKIVFISNRDGNDELYMMDYDGHNQIRLTFNKVKDYMPAWSPDGQSIAYTSWQNDKAILFNLNPFEGQRKTIQTEGTNFSPAFSPDGKILAYCSTISEGNSEIYIAKLNNLSIKRLTFNKAIDTAPSWSPTGREIAFTSDRGGTPQIYIMDAEGSNVRRISFGGSYHDGPAWAPTGDRISYVSRVNQIFDIYVLYLQTNRIIKLTESNARNESPCWSPDGRHIIFSSNLNGSIQLYTIDYDGTNLKRLTSKGENKLPDWSR